MRDLVDEYLAQRTAEGLAPRSQAVYRKRLERLLAHCRRQGCRRWADVTPEDCRSLMLALAAQGLARSTRCGFATTIARFFRWLQETGRILVHPALDLPVPDDREPDLPAPPLEEAEIQRIFDAIPRRHVIDLRNRAHLELLYGCALRLAESTALKVDDLDLDRRTVHVREAKGGSDRIIPLMKGSIGALRDYLALRRSLLRGPDVGTLFLTRRGRPVQGACFRQWLASLGKALGLHLHPHLFRHSIAVHLLRGGADIRHVQAFLGHARLDTTKVYLRMVPGRLAEEYDETMPALRFAMHRNGK